MQELTVLNHLFQERAELPRLAAGGPRPQVGSTPTLRYSEKTVWGRLAGFVRVQAARMRTWAYRLDRFEAWLLRKDVRAKGRRD